MSIKKTALAILLAAGISSTAWAADLAVDPSHSNISFSVKHMFTNAIGRFTEFNGTFSFDDKSARITGIDFTVSANSVSTLEEKRDKHLRSVDFFDVAAYPTITFKGASVKNTGKGRFDVTGVLTLHGISKVVTFKALYLGKALSPWGQETSSFSASTIINRKDFGIVWNKALDNGGLLIGNEVTISVELEAKPVPTK